MNDPNFPPKQAIWMGLAFVVFGSIPMLAALGVIPAKDDSFHIPRWLVAVVTACFPAAGVWMLSNGVARLMGAQSTLAATLSRVGYWCLALAIFSFIGGLAIFFTWELIAPFPGASQGAEIMGFAFSPESLVGRVMNRFGAAIGALVFDSIVLFVAWAAIKSLFAPKGSPPSSRGGPASPR